MAKYKLMVIKYTTVKTKVGKRTQTVLDMAPVNVAMFEKHGFTAQDKKGLMFTLEAMGAKKVKEM